MKNKKVIIHLLFFICFPIFIAIAIDGIIFEFISIKIHTEINKNIPNTMQLILPSDIKIGEFIDFITEQKQPSGMNSQIYSVAIQRLKESEINSQINQIKVLNILSYRNFLPLKDVQLFSVSNLNLGKLFFYLILIILSFLIKKYIFMNSVLKKINFSSLIISLGLVISNFFTIGFGIATYFWLTFLIFITKKGGKNEI